MLSKSSDPLDWTQPGPSLYYHWTDTVPPCIGLSLEFYLASCRCLPHPDGFALLTSSIHSILCCHISAHQRCFASNKMWCLSSAPLCLHPRGLLLIHYPSWAIAFSNCLFITSDLSSGGRCHYQVRFSDCSAQSSCRDSSEGLPVCGYNDRLLFVFLFCTFKGKRKPFCHLSSLYSDHLWELWTCFLGHGHPHPVFPLSICFLANMSIPTEDQNNS